MSVCVYVAWVYLTKKVTLINSGDSSFVHASAVGRTLSLTVKVFYLSFSNLIVITSLAKLLQDG